MALEGVGVVGELVLEGELVAAGHLTFAAAGTGTIKVKLTVAGKSLLKHAKQLKLAALGTFTPTGKSPSNATRKFVLKR